MSRAGLVAVALFASWVGAQPAAAADIEAGKAVYQRCKVCHSVEAGRASPLGPNLHGVFGRKAGSAAGYKYSEAIQISGIVWDDASLARFLRDPKDTVPGNRMAFPGVKDDKQLDDLLAYLHEAAK